MPEVGLREMRQNASELVARAQKGERFTVTVSGRPAAELGPVKDRQWRNWEEIAEVFAGPGDPDWNKDRDLIPDSLDDPWERQ